MKLDKSTLKRLIKEEIQKSKLNLKEVDANEIEEVANAVIANAKEAKVDLGELDKLDKEDDGGPRFQEAVEALMPDSDVSNNDDAKEAVINKIREKLKLQESKRLTKESLKAFVRDVIQEVTMDYVKARTREMEYDGEVAPEDEPKWKEMAKKAAKAAYKGGLMPDDHESFMKYSPGEYAPAFKAALRKLQNP